MKFQWLHPLLALYDLYVLYKKKTHRCASLVNIFEQMCLRSWNDRTFIFLRKYWFARLQFVRYECYDCDWKTMLWQAHSAEIEIHSVALGRIFKTLVCLQGIWKFTAMLVSFVFCPFFCRLTVSIVSTGRLTSGCLRVIHFSWVIGVS